MFEIYAVREISLEVPVKLLEAGVWYAYCGYYNTAINNNEKSLQAEQADLRRSSDLGL